MPTALTDLPAKADPPRKRWTRDEYERLSIETLGPERLEFIVLEREQSEFLRSNPGPADLRLIVEIADTTLGFDLTTKARLYARAAIVEYWVLDLAGRRMIVHRDPPEGQYRAVVAFGDDESVAPLAAPASELHVRDVLPG